MTNCTTTADRSSLTTTSNGGATALATRTGEPNMQNSQPNTSPTSQQQTLWEAFAAADEAIKRVDENADEGWKRAAAQAVWDRSRLSAPFTTDDIMDDLDNMGVTTHDNRALGPVIRRMVRKEVIHEVGMTRSRRRHGARIPIYAGKPRTTTQERGA